jgi:hypothetical protein
MAPREVIHTMVILKALIIELTEKDTILLSRNAPFANMPSISALSFLPTPGLRTLETVSFILPKTFSRVVPRTMIINESQ